MPAAARSSSSSSASAILTGRRPADARDVPEKKLADDTADRLRRAILTGALPFGADLPGERDLSAQLGVSRLTLRAALARLEAEQLVKPVHGSGNRVLDYRETGGVELLGHLFTLATTTSDPTPAGNPAQLLADLLELRRVVAIEVLGLAAERATDDELLALRRQADQLAALTDDIASFMRADIALALSLVKATHNLALVFLSNTIVRVLLAQPGIEAAFAVNPVATVATYRRLAALLAARDAVGARRLGRLLLRRLDRALVTAVAAFSPSSFPSDLAPHVAPHVDR